MTIVFACLSKAGDENVGMESKRESSAKLLGSYVRYPGCQLQPPCATPSSHLCNTQINLCAMISSRPFFFFYSFANKSNSWQDMAGYRFLLQAERGQRGR